MTSSRLVLFGLIISSFARAGIATVDFEAFGDGTVLTNQVGGLLFANATVWSAGLSLNELEFAPHSGSNVAVDAGGPMSIVFASPVSSVSGFFTYSTSLTLAAFDALNQAVGTTSSSFASNFVSSGHNPNEVLQVSVAGGISRVLIAGDPNGASFALDDLTVTTPASNVPEPSSGVLLVSGVMVLIFGSRVGRVRSGR